MGASKDSLLAKPTQGKLYYKMQNYAINKNNVYFDRCDKCKKEFIYKGSYIKDRAVVCPHCGYDMMFFSGNYDFVPLSASDITKEELESMITCR